MPRDHERLSVETRDHPFLLIVNQALLSSPTLSDVSRGGVGVLHEAPISGTDLILVARPAASSQKPVQVQLHRIYSISAPPGYRSGFQMVAASPAEVDTVMREAVRCHLRMNPDLFFYFSREFGKFIQQELFEALVIYVRQRVSQQDVHAVCHNVWLTAVSTWAERLYSFDVGDIDQKTGVLRSISWDVNGVKGWLLSLTRAEITTYRRHQKRFVALPLKMTRTVSHTVSEKMELERLFLKVEHDHGEEDAMLIYWIARGHSYEEALERFKAEYPDGELARKTPAALRTRKYRILQLLE